MSQVLRPYPEYKDSGVPWLGRVPASWRVVRLKRLATLNPSKSEMTDEERRGEAVFLPMRSVGTTGHIDISLSMPVSQLQSGFTYFRRGDVIVAKITPCFENGKGACLDTLPTPVGFGSTEYHVLRAHVGLHSRFLYRLTTLPDFRQLGERAMTGSAGQQRVPDDFVANFVVAVPELPEQCQIEAFLRSIDRNVYRFIRNRRRLIEVLHEQKQAIIHRAVTRGLDDSAPLKPSDIEWLGEIPTDWLVLPVRRLSTFITSGPRDWSRLIGDEGDLFLQSGNLGRSMELKLEGANRLRPPCCAETQRTRVQRDDILICVTGALTGNVAHVAAELTPAYVNQHVALVRADRDKVISRYLAYVLHSQCGRIQFKNAEYGGTKQGLSLGDVASALSPVPPVDQQVAIAHRLDNLSRATSLAIAIAEREINLIREYRTRLIADVVTGKLDVRHLAPPPDMSTDEAYENVVEEDTGEDETAIEAVAAGETDGD